MRRRRSLVLGMLAALALAAITAVAVQAATTVRLKTVANKYAFNTKTLHARHGKVTVKMLNVSSLKHGIAVEGHGVDKDGKIVGKGKTSTLTVTLKRGTYTFYCPVPGHKALGMKGKLIVQ
jgi:plastocyanin